MCFPDLKGTVNWLRKLKEKFKHFLSVLIHFIVFLRFLYRTVSNEEQIDKTVFFVPIKWASLSWEAD